VEETERSEEMIGLFIALYYCYSHVFAGGSLADTQSDALFMAIGIEIILEMAIGLKLWELKGGKR
jgi:hypothetical protein